MKNLLSLLLFILIMGSGCSNNSTEVASCSADDKNSLELVMNLQIKVKPDCVSLFRDSFEECRIGTLQEPGCISYDMYQSYADSTMFFVVETWKNKQAHTEHTETAHFLAHQERTKDVRDPGFTNAMRRLIYVCPAVNE